MGGRYWLWMGARLLAAVAIVAWAASYLSPGSGEKEFQKTLEAMKNVHSFRAASTSTAYNTHNDLSWEVDCNRNVVHYQQHLDTCADPPACTQNSEMKQDQITWAVYQYDRQNDGSWAASRHPASNLPRQICGHLKEGTDTYVLPQIATMIKRGILQKGDKKTVNGVRCREWLVTMKGAPSGFEHDTVCLGLDDHLPYEMTVDWEHAHALYSDYNTTIQFDLPTEVQANANGSN
jgi:hypothetical protein